MACKVLVIGGLIGVTSEEAGAYIISHEDVVFS